MQFNRPVYILDHMNSRGGPIFVIAQMLKKYGCEVFRYTSDANRTGVIIGHGVIIDGLPKRMPKIVFVAGGKQKDNGLIKKTDWKRVYHVVFNSNFVRNIGISQFPNISTKSSIIHVFGGCHADNLIFIPHSNGKQLNDDKIEFFISAKWSKRPFKRRRQSVKLFRDYIKPKYKNAIMHVIGSEVSKIAEEDGIFYYPEDFYSSIVKDITCKSHIHLMLSSYDTGPMTVSEAMHYRVPFVISNNCGAKEYQEHIIGKSGEIAEIDPVIKNKNDCQKLKPMTSSTYIKGDINYSLVMKSIDKIINNYSEYTSWKWKHDDPYLAQAQKWATVINNA